MENKAGTPFELDSTIEQPLPQDQAVRNVLERWGRIDGFVTIKFGPGKDPRFPDKPVTTVGKNWRPESQIVKFDPDQRVVYIPEDLNLMEVPEVLDALGSIAIAKDPEIFKTKATELRKLGKVFENASIYIAKRLPLGRGYMPSDNILNDQGNLGYYLVYEFSEYGHALQKGTFTPNRSWISQPSVGTAKYMAIHNDVVRKLAEGPDLTPEETETIDRWLAGDKLYQSRKKKIASFIETHPKNAVQEWERLNRDTLIHAGWSGNYTFEAVAKQPTVEGKITELVRQKTLIEFLVALERAYKLEYRDARRTVADRIMPGEKLLPPITRLLDPVFFDRYKRTFRSDPEYWKWFNKTYPRSSRKTTKQGEFPEQTQSAHGKFLRQIEAGIKGQIEEPKRQLIDAFSPPEKPQTGGGLWNKVKSAISAIIKS